MGNNLLREIEYHYYSKGYGYCDKNTKLDNKGISMIKKFIRIMYTKFGEAQKIKEE